jgi:hypothetical protein
MYFDVGWINSFDANGTVMWAFLQERERDRGRFYPAADRAPIDTIKRNAVEGPCSNSRGHAPH